MNLLPSSEQAELVAAAAAFLAKEAGGGFSRELWARMGGLGWFALGEAGYGVVEEALLFRELGRALAPGPFLPQVLAAHLASGELLAAIAGGSVVVALASPHGDPAAGIYRVVWAEGPDLLLVVAGDGVALVGAGAATAWEHHAGFDPSSPVALVRLETPPVSVSAPELVARGRVLAAAALAGICEATRDESAAYACQREQFGRPIGSFQAVKHRCADMAVRAEAAGSLTFLAALSLATGDASLVDSAKALAGEHALANAADDIQNHGGTGFTAGCAAHRYLKRAQLLSAVLGAPAQLYLDSARG
jgi:alkylation response protein AidB-like acyl-CoA dehydrogenase